MKCLPMGAAANIFLLLLLSFSATQKAAAAAQQQQQPVTFGSAIALVHEASGHKLYSGKISWGSSSAGQAVTAQPPTDSSSSSLWQLQHLSSQASLRAGQGEAPLSPNYEVGAAAGAEGLDAVFMVECVKGGDVYLQQLRTGLPHSEPPRGFSDEGPAIFVVLEQAR
ncbi:hypothetical protein, conserved [Eimeria brunetti]|uniref:MIR domain-containing protein n=1 Tax=Eimeria brunetti TaxID=51314 RepID=U6LD44_9EIME|nr:hypothetical protein, conserved [Eimeria brunetti]